MSDWKRRQVSNWRERLSKPQKPRTLPEMMTLALEMAVEDAAALQETPPNSSARREFFELAGFDLYDRIGEVLDAMMAAQRVAEYQQPIPPELRAMFDRDVRG